MGSDRTFEELSTAGVGIAPMKPVRPSRELLAGVVVGGAAGGLAWVLSTQVSTNWSAYLAAGLVLATVAPVLLPVLGGFQRVAAVSFVFALTLELDWFVSFRPRPYPGGVNGFGLNMMVLAGLAYAGHRWVMGQFSSARPWTFDRRLVLAALFFLGTSLLSVVGAVDRHQWAFGLFLNLSMVFVAFVACDIAAGSNERELRGLWRVVLVAVIFEAGMVLLQNALGYGFTLKGEIYRRFGEHGRYSGSFTTPSATGTFLVVGLCFALVAFLTRRAHLGRFLTTLALGAGTLALLLTETRTAWIAFAGGATALLIWLMRSGLIRPRRVWQLGLVAAIGVAIAAPLVLSRLGDDHTSDFEVRWNLALIAFQIIKSHPLMGVGINTCSLVVGNYIPPGWGGHWVFVTHNQFLLMAAEAGLPGLVALIWLFAVGVRSIREAFTWTDSLFRDTGAVLAVVLWSLVWALNLDFVQGSQTYYLVFFLIGFAVGLPYAARREAGPPTLATVRDHA